MKKKQATSVFLYLGRRDKSGVRVIAVFQGQEQSPVRLKDNLHVLQLPINLHTEIARIVHEDRMMWEPWIESAPTYADLKTSLKRRGYNGLPTSGQPELTAGFIGNPTVVAQSNLPRVATMVRKKI